MPTPQERANYYVVDKRGEGGLVSELDRVAMADQPTLIIGLGGTGTDALLHTKYVLRRKLKYPDGHDRPGRLDFLVIDTDTQDLDGKQVGGVGVDQSERCDITEPNLKNYMHDPGQIPHDYQRDWLCNGISADFINFGAGGIRQCGRFMLFMKVEEVVNKIKNKITDIWGAGKENGASFSSNNDAINVYIMTGISGGTGSGTFLDIAYLVRHIVTEQLGHKLRLRGVIFMPDVNQCKVKDPAVQKYLPVNGYAALKELDFWMNAERGRNFRQQYSALISIDTAEKPFDMCFMISPNGGQEEDYTDCMQTTGEALLNILSASVDQTVQDGKTTGGTAPKAQNFESYVVNLVSMLPHTIKKYSGNYIYASLGMDERRLQMDQMANLIAYYLLGRVNKLFDRVPSDAEVNDCFKKLKLDSKRGMRDQFDRTLPAKPFDSPVRNLDDLIKQAENYKKPDVLNDGVLEEELKIWVAQCEAVYGQRKIELRDEILRNIQERIEKYFKDLKYGPFYAHKLLYNTAAGKKDILSKLQEEWDAVKAFLMSADDRLKVLSKQCQEKRKSAKGSMWVPIVSNSTYKEYIEAAYALFDHVRYAKLCVVLNTLYGQIINDVSNYNNLIVERFSTLLSELAKVFESNSKIMARVDQDGNTHTWNIGNFDKIKAIVDEAFAQMEGDGTTDKLVAEFLEMLLRDRDSWVGDRGDLGASFSRFVSEKFAGLMNDTLENSYKKMHNLATDQELQDYIRTTVLPQMESNSKVLYIPDDTLSPIENAPHRAMISYPQKATNIGNAVQSYVVARGIKADVVPSLRNGSLFWFEACFGLPLYAHKSVPNMQLAYDVFGREDHHLGRQLKMGDDENWLQLMPPLMPEAIWNIKRYNNTALAERNANSRAMMRDAWENFHGSVIQQMPGAGGAQVFVLGKVDQGQLSQLESEAPLNAEEQKRLGEEGVNAAAAMHKNMMAVKAFVDKAKAFDASAWQPSMADKFKQDNFDLLMNGETVSTEQQLHNEQTLAENLLLTPDMADKLSEQLRLKKHLRDVIAAHETYLELGDQEKKQREMYANAWKYGLYYKVGPKVYQLDVTGTGLQTFPLMNIPDYALAPAEDRFYAMFKKFISLPEGQREIIRKVIDLRERTMNQEMQSGNYESYNRYLQIVRALDAALEKRMNAINMDITFDRPEIRDFYIKLREHLSTMLSDDDEL